MSSFAVTIREIEAVWKHPNADRLDLCRVKGLDYQFVYAKDQLKVGDLVAYFPVDSLIKDELIEIMGLTGKLSGSGHNKVKTVKLRDAISQGVVAPEEQIHQYLQKYKGGDQSFCVGMDVTELLGVEKYSPPEVKCDCGNLVPLPDGNSVYDIEGCDNHPDILSLLMDEAVCVTEKLEGQNYSITYTPEGKFQVNQRCYSIVEVPVEGKENTLWAVARRDNLLDLTRDLCKIGGFKTVTLYGELIGFGVEGNIYGLKDHKVLFYDIYADYHWVNVYDKFYLFSEAEGKESGECDIIVPILGYEVILREWLEGKTIKEASHGISKLKPSPTLQKNVVSKKNKECLREGIVITPMIEKRHESIGRLILKQRDPIYLANQEE